MKAVTASNLLSGAFAVLMLVPVVREPLHLPRPASYVCPLLALVCSLARLRLLQRYPLPTPTAAATFRRTRRMCLFVLLYAVGVVVLSESGAGAALRLPVPWSAPILAGTGLLLILLLAYLAFQQRRRDHGEV